MRRQRIFAAVAAVLMSVGLFFTAGVCAKAENSEVTTNKVGKISFHLEHSAGKSKPFTDEDLKVIAMALYAQTIDNDGQSIINQNTVFSVDWQNSQLKKEDVWGTQVNYYWFQRDASDKLVLNRAGGGTYFSGLTPQGNKLTEYDTYYPEHWGWNFYDNGKDKYSCSFEGDNWGPDWAVKLGKPDLVCIYAQYNPEFSTMRDGSQVVTTYSFSGQYYIVEKENSVFHFKDIATNPPETQENPTSATTPAAPEPSLNPDVTENNSTQAAAEENYVVSVSGSNSAISKEDFAAVLAQNQTKDVVIKTGSDISFTFKKGTMKAVDGKEQYDFSAIVNRDYASATGLPSFVTSDNFVQKITYGYSGQLPAEASIRMYVGTERAGQTLYYSRLLDGTSVSVVQSAQVDAQGYITVTQSHCSDYIVTNTEPKAVENTVPASEDGVPAQGGSIFIIILCVFIFLCVAAIVTVIILRKRIKG